MRFSTTQGVIIMTAAFALLVLGFTQHKPSHVPVPQPSTQVSVPAPGFEGIEETEVIAPPEDGEIIDTSDWVEYRNDEYGFKIKIPNGNEILTRLGGDAYINFSVYPDGWRDSRWGIDRWNTVPWEQGKGTEQFIEDQIRQQGSQWGENRREVREATSVGGMSAQRVTVTTESHPDWVSVNVYLARGDIVWAFRNGARDDPEFDIWLSTFEFIDSGSSTIDANSIATKEICESAGGTWKQWGLAPVESCNIPTADADKLCSDSDECESACLAQDGHGSDDAVQGTCYGWQKLLGGCFSYVENGKIDFAICID